MLVANQHRRFSIVVGSDQQPERLTEAHGLPDASSITLQAQERLPMMATPNQ